MISSGLRRIHRQEYLREHAESRRTATKAAGAKHIEVTLQGVDLKHYEQVRDWLDRNNRLAIERGVYNSPKTLPDGRTYTVSAPPLSATEIIPSALRLATSAIENDEKGR